MANDTEEERIKMKSLKLDEPVQGEPNMYTNQPKANADGILVKKKTKGDDTVLEENLHSSPVMFDLNEAVLDRRFETVQYLLQLGADPNKISSDCFRRIVDMNDRMMLRVLIEGGFRLNKDTFDLAKAVLNGDENKVANFFGSGADLSQIPDDYIKELVENREIRILKVLIEGGLKLKQIPDNRIQELVENREIGILKVLIEGGVKPKQVMFDLYEAVLDRNIRKVRYLLQRGADPNKCFSDCFRRILDLNDSRMLKVMIEGGLELKKTENVKILSENSRNVYIFVKKPRTRIYYISSDCFRRIIDMNDRRMLKVLIEGGLRLNKDTFDLAKAVLNGDENKVAKLLKRDADLSQIPDDCIQELVENREIRILKVLIKGGLEQKQKFQIPDNCIQELVENREFGILKDLKEVGLELKQMDIFDLYEAVLDRDIKKVRHLLRRGADPNKIPYDCIQELVENREFGILKVLKEGGLKLNQVMFDLYEAVLDRDIGKVRHLLRRGADPNQIPDDCIQELVDIREIGILKVLLEGGLKLKQIPDIFIHELVHNGEIGMLKVLLERGLKLKKIPDLFITKVVYRRHDEMLKIFVEGGWDVNRIPDRCIHELVYKRNIGMLKVLLEGGLELERISEDAIDDLVNTRDIEILKALLKGGLEVKRIPDPVVDRLVHTDDVEMLNVLVERGLVLKRDTRTDEDSERHPDGNITTKRMDGAKQVATVVKENDMKAFMSLKDTFVAAYPLGESSWHLLHIVAVYGTAEMVDCIQRWTRIDWDRQHTIHEDIFEKTSRYTKVKEATALYLASCLDRTDIVRSLVKLAGEDNIRSCLQGITLSIKLEHVFMLQLADRLRQKHAELKPTIVPGYRREDNGTQSRVFIVYSVYVVHGNDYDFNGLGLVKLRNPYIIKRTNCGALASETGVKNEDAETEPDEDAHVEKSPDDDADSSNEDVDGLSNEDAKRVTEAIQTHRDCLWQTHSNLNIITGRRVKRNINGFDIHEACVILYCSTKGVIPLGEDEFPRKLAIQNGDYVNVVVREGFFDFGGYATASGTSRHDYLKMGCEIGRSTPQFDTRGRSIRNSGGTLGPFVRFNNDLGFLTCAHVLFDIPSHSNSIDFTAAFSMVQVVQPSMNSTASVNAKECGVVERAVFDPSRTISIDATVVKITDQSRKPTAGQFANERHSTYEDAGFKELPEYNNGFMLSNAQLNALPSKPNVVKFGSRTDVTKGALGVVGADVRAYSKALGFGDGAVKVWIENQYLVTGIPPSTDFFDGGDSGSAVFCRDGNGHLVCVGMAIGHCVLDDYPYKAGIVTPIDAILQALGPNFKLATFP